MKETEEMEREKRESRREGEKRMKRGCHGRREKEKRPLYLAVLKIVQQMAAGAALTRASSSLYRTCNR